MIHLYCFHSEKKIIVSDLPVEKIRKTYGFKYEVLTSFKEKTAVEVMLPKISSSYPKYEIVEKYFTPRPPRPKRPMSEETKRKIAESHRGKKMAPEVKARISNKMKGKSNFENKRHREESKEKIGLKMIGNDHVKGTRWVYNPNTSKELRVRSLLAVPRGFIKGRDYSSTEEVNYALSLYRKRIQNDW